MAFKSAAELDRYLTAVDTYEAATAEGKTPEEAEEVAREAVRAKHQEQVLASVGVGLPPRGCSVMGDK